MMSQDDTFPAYDELKLESGDSVDELLQDGLFRFGAGDTKGAVEAWQRVLEIDPGNADAVDYLRTSGVSPIVRPSPAPHLRVAPEESVRIKSESAPAPEPEPEPRHSIHRSQPMPVIGGELVERARNSSVIVAPPPKTPDRRLFYGVVAIASILLIGVVGLIASMGGTNEDKAQETAARSADNGAKNGAVENRGDSLSAAPVLETETTFELDLEVSPSEASLILDGRVVGTGKVKLSLPKDGSNHTLIIRADGFVEKHVAFVDVAPTKSVELARLPRASATSQKRTRRARRSKKAATPSKTSVVKPTEPAPRREEPKAAPDKPASESDSIKRAKDIKDPWNK